jgi:hypothetical protein
MQTQDINRRACWAAGGLCGIGLLSNSIAGTVASRAAPFISTLASEPAAKAVLVLPALKISLSLDLPVLSAPTLHAGATASGSDDFLRIERPAHAAVDFGAQAHSAALGLGINDANFRASTPVDRFVARVRREGLPIARLWQSESSLVSIGFNQRGKPGLWFTKRIH